MNDLQIYLLGDALDYQKDKLLEFVEVLRGKKSITYYLGKYGLTGQALYSLCVLCDFDIKIQIYVFPWILNRMPAENLLFRLHRPQILWAKVISCVQIMNCCN